jgi:hypothetical protein
MQGFCSRRLMANPFAARKCADASAAMHAEKACSDAEPIVYERQVESRYYASHPPSVREDG